MGTGVDPEVDWGHQVEPMRQRKVTVGGSEERGFVTLQEPLLEEIPTPDGGDVLDSVYVPSQIHALALLIEQQGLSDSLLFPRLWTQVIARGGEATYSGAPSEERLLSLCSGPSVPVGALALSVAT